MLEANAYISLSQQWITQFIQVQHLLKYSLIFEAFTISNLIEHDLYRVDKKQRHLEKTQHKHNKMKNTSSFIVNQIDAFSSIKLEKHEWGEVLCV